MTAREQIFELVDQALGGGAIDGLSEYAFEPDRDPARFPALHSFDGGQLPIEEEVGATRYALTIVIEGFVEQAAGAAARTALNDLHAKAVAAIMGDPELAALVETVRESGPLRIDTAELANKKRRGFSQDFEITFATVRGDPGAFA